MFARVPRSWRLVIAAGYVVALTAFLRVFLSDLFFASGSWNGHVESAAFAPLGLGRFAVLAGVPALLLILRVRIGWSTLVMWAVVVAGAGTLCALTLMPLTHGATVGSTGLQLLGLAVLLCGIMAVCEFVLPAFAPGRKAEESLREVLQHLPPTGPRSDVLGLLLLILFVAGILWLCMVQ